MACTECDSPLCTGELNTLRQFSSWNDLAAHVDEETILGWVNQLEKALSQLSNVKLYGKRYRERKKQFANIAKQLLDPDELKEIRRQVDAKLFE